MRKAVRVALALAATLMLACGSQPEPAGNGSAHLEVTARGLSLADVAQVNVTVSGPHISPDIVQTLTGDPASGWSGTISGIPAGPDRTFAAVALDAAGLPLYAGSATGVTIVNGATASVSIFLQQAVPPTPFANSVPRFTSLVISDDTVAPGQTITLTVTAVDPDPGDTLTYAWTAIGGAFGSPNAASTTWTAPRTSGVYQLVATAADPKGATAALSVSLDVEVYNGSGSALVNATLNTWPVVASLVPSPTRIDVGETTHLDLTASDPDGDALTYAWSASCAVSRPGDPVPVHGVFDDPTAEDPSFTLSRLPDSGSCTLTATISDGRGGTNTARITIETGPGVTSTWWRVAGGFDFSLGITSNGDLYAWGENLYGQLGDGTTTSRTSPVLVGTGFASVAAFYIHSLAIKRNGDLYAWGDNGAGQLGDGSTTNRTSPVLIGTGFASVAAGMNYSLAIKSNGDLYAWGYNGSGQLGDGTTTNRTSPVLIGAGFASVAGGAGHSLAVKSNGDLYAWGDNQYGQLGDGSTTDRTSPVLVGTGYASVAAGYYHSLAIETGGGLYAWGDNQYGELGDGSITERTSPVLVGTGYASVAAGAIHSLAIKTGGGLFAWGNNQLGQLGDGSTTGRISPVLVGAGYASVAAGAFHSLAIKTGGNRYAWGWNAHGQLGDGSTTDSALPVLIIGSVH